jgi:hypothetical protein
MIDDADLEHDEMMHRVRTIHPELMDACEAVVKALGNLLDALDDGTVAEDYRLERRYGKRVLDAYLGAEKAYGDVESYFAEDES